MKSDFKAKMLQYFAAKKKGNGGFTLIELLVVIIIIGILSAIALPSFLNQANKAKQSEAKTYIGSMNRAQQAYFLENDSFANNDASFALLGLGISSSTGNYNYKIVGSPSTTTNQAQPKAGVTASVKAYLGGVKVDKLTTSGVSEATTVALLCEAKDAPIITPGSLGNVAANYGASGTAMACPTDYAPVK